ncbi:DUF6461 domain-containing protein [Streptomyces ipomoeae]|uniref:Uncharacterized protein n=1 Tax=Streptomyces ipomoeae 91-03 TaxID=698759 RepID=L1L4S5_9ACTN|nr:DUF6461 domain-containing protein [Streptomyces ipomoeae]EKX67710.1 hypothetical protein STRIP9103_03725 [Streptomyces ipomoeae 91-03]MDX2699380.1 DUF6461 domain-containing protein [Streptomyces ipomoeae]MDX2845315.1 DUF6461 domain-containing protein [Streptomyces ipomoeae]
MNSCEWAFGIGERHSEGIRGEVLRRLSYGTRAVAVRHINGTTMLSCYENGALVTTYDSQRAHRLDGERDPLEVIPAPPAYDDSAMRRRADGATDRPWSGSTGSTCVLSSSPSRAPGAGSMPK